MGCVEPVREPVVAARAPLDADSRSWVDELGQPPRERDRAVARLHAYLLRVARFELGRRRGALPPVTRRELDDLAVQAADDALVAVLRKLPTYRGASRFTTWAAKFAILEATVKARRRAWHDRELTPSRRPGSASARPARPRRASSRQSSSRRSATASAPRSRRTSARSWSRPR